MDQSTGRFSHFVTAVLSSLFDFGANSGILPLAFEADSVAADDKGHTVEIRVRLEG